MDVKWFFVIVAIFLTSAILIGMYFISLNQSVQDRAYFIETQKNADQRFDNTSLIHEYLFRNITDIKKGLDPILATVKNATEMHEQQLTHYNQSQENSQKLDQILSILTTNNNNNTKPIIENVTPVPAPIIKNDTGDIVIENVTKDNSTSNNGTILILQK